MKTITLLLAVILTFHTTAHAAKPDLSAPKAAVRSFYQSALDGDVDAVKKIVIDDPDHQRAAAAVVRITPELVKLDAAARKTFSTSLSSDGNPRVSLRIPDPNAVNYAKVEGDDQFATVTGRRREAAAARAKGRQRLAVDMTDAEVKTTHLPQVAEMVARLLPGMTELTAEIDSGKFNT